MSSDLISRDALLKAMEQERQFLLARGQTGAEHILVHHCLPIIDRTPTVEPKLKDDIIEAFNQITDQEFEHSDSFWIVTPKGKKIEFVKKRPQGKWESFNSYYRKCNQCERVVGFDYADPEHGNWFNFCPNCGADMRGEKKEGEDND